MLNSPRPVFALWIGLVFLFRLFCSCCWDEEREVCFLKLCWDEWEVVAKQRRIDPQVKNMGVFFGDRKKL